MDLLALLVTLLLFGLLWWGSRHHLNFGSRTLIAAGLGLLVGFIFKGHTPYVKVFGSIYANLLFSIVIPLLFTSIVSTVVSLESVDKMKSIGAKTVGVLSLHNVLGSLIGLILGLLFHVGANSQLTLPANATAKEVPSFADAFVHFFPDNILGNMAEAKVVPVIIFAVLLGLAILQLKERGEETKAEPFVHFIQSAAAVIFRLTGMIMDFTPYAVLSLMANAVSRTDMAAMMPLLVVLVLTYVAALIHSYVTTGVLLALFAKVNPLRFFKKFWPVQMIAFTTQSSVGTIPANVECLRDKLGVSERIATFVASLGATVGMPGCAGFWPVLSAIVTIHVMGLSYSVGQYLLLIVVALAVSLGTVGVPGTATITTTAVFATMGLPVEMVVLMSPISMLADMGRTATNVTAAGSSALIVAASEGALDRNIFNE